MSKAEEFRILGRKAGSDESIRFEYRGVTFDQDCFHVVAGLNAVDTREYTEQTFRCRTRRARRISERKRCSIRPDSRATSGRSTLIATVSPSSRSKAL